MIRFEEDDVPGNPGAPETPEMEARRIALDALSRPLDIQAPGYEGESADVMAQARGLQPTERPRTVMAGDALMAGMGPDDAIAPARTPAARPVVQLTEEDVPAFGAPASSTVQLTEEDVPPFRAPPRRDDMAAIQRLAPGSDPNARPKSETADRAPGGAMEAELRAASEARARRMIANTAGAGIEILGSLAAGVPVRHGSPTLAGPQEDEGRIRREHRLAALEKDREGQAAAAQQARAEREATLSDREMSLRERMAEIAAQRANRTESPSEIDAARTDQIRAAMADREARRDPFSPQSRAAQGQFTAVLDSLPPSVRTRLAAFNEERVRGMSADELVAPTAMLGRITPRVSGGGAARPRADRGALEEEARRLGLSDAVIGGMSDAQIVSELNQRSSAAEPIEIIAGVTTDADISDRQRTTAANQIIRARQAMSALAHIESLQQRYGASATVTPAVEREIAADMMTLRGIASEVQGTGTITEGEMPAINASIPDITSFRGQALGTLAASFRGWRERLRANTEDTLRGLGANDEGVSRGLEYLGSGRAQSVRSRAAAERERAPSGDMVRVRLPDGRTGRMPRSSVPEGVTVLDGP